jgi:hypothetical protein
MSLRCGDCENMIRYEPRVSAEMVFPAAGGFRVGPGRAAKCRPHSGEALEGPHCRALKVKPAILQRAYPLAGRGEACVSNVMSLSAAGGSCGPGPRTMSRALIR